MSHCVVLVILVRRTIVKKILHWRLPLQDRVRHFVCVVGWHLNRIDLVNGRRMVNWSTRGWPCPFSLSNSIIAHLVSIANLLVSRATPAIFLTVLVCNIVLHLLMRCLWLVLVLVRRRILLVKLD